LDLGSILQEQNIIGTKWIFKNKTDEHGTVVLNKARLVDQGYTEIEGVDFDETFALVARLESIRILLSISCHLGFKLYQMDVKSAFMNGILQAHRAWYERLTTYLLTKGFTRGQADRTLFIRNQGIHKLIAQIYVDAIIFGATLDSLTDEFSEKISKNLR